MLCVGQFGAGFWEWVRAVCGRVWSGFGEWVRAVCGTVWSEFEGVSVCCVSECLEWVWGNEIVLCVGQFGVGLVE